MPREADLRFGLFALRMKLVTSDQFLESAGLWLNDLDRAALAGGLPRTLPELLRELHYLDADACASVEAALSADDRPPTLEAAVRQALLDLRPPGDLVAWILGLAVGVEVEGAFQALPREDRYELVREIARGGLGRVMEARDRHLERELAVKLVLDDMPAEARERFVREARITGRLDHPNIVPVYDFDDLPGPDGGKRLMLCMKRVRGRDLGTLLQEIRRGDPEVAGRWSQARLLRVCQDICLGIAFAHSRGVLHRDLKPSNVMIGDYGETLIVDWGLAKELGGKAGLSGEARIVNAGVPVGTRAAETEREDLSELTLEGDVIGTPLYMSPEQAAGRISELDARSDIFSLGGILYTILTHRPPFTGSTRHQVIENVLAGRFSAPSLVVEAARAAHEAAGRDGQVPPAPEAIPEPVPPDLDAICLRALAHRKEDRYSSALELHDEIQLFLEGVKVRERERVAADEAVRMAREAMERHGRLKAEAKAAAVEAGEREKDLKPLEDKSAVWSAQDRGRELERQSVEAFADAGSLLTVALSHDQKHSEARRLNAELFWGQFLEAEAREDEREMLLTRRLVERYNDGPLDARMKGDGALSVRTREYPCRCLVDGRMVKPRDLAWMGYHPFSGRSLDGMKGAEGLPELEPKEPVRLKVHGPECRPLAVEGADVWLFRYEEIGRRLFPVTPSGLGGAGKRPVPASVVRATFETASPYLPQGPGIWLGRTPIESRALPMGSYLLLVGCEGRESLRVPVSIPRCGAWEQEVTLFRPEEIPPGHVAISAGTFGFQGDRANVHSGPAETKFVDDVFFARHPVTCREYCEFLNGVAQHDPVGAAKRVPRQAEDAGFYWPGPPYAVPSAGWLKAASTDFRAKARRLQGSPVDWEEEWPVFGISWEDMMAFCAWRRTRDPRAVTLPHDAVWEKAARGTDRRFYPSGRHQDERWYNAQGSHPGGSRPVPVQEFPADESPYGVRGMAGNCKNACLNSPGAEYPGWRAFRGGYWTDAGFYSRSSTRTGYGCRHVHWIYGGRVAVICRLPGLPDTAPGPAAPTSSS